MSKAAGSARKPQVLHHVGLTVADIERSLVFWCGALGCRLLVRQEKGGGYFEVLTGEPGAHTLQAHLELPGSAIRIVLLQYEVPRTDPVRPPLSAPGASHIALIHDDVEDALARAVAAGGTAVSDPVVVDTGENSGMRAVYVRDPDGHVVEIIRFP